MYHAPGYIWALALTGAIGIPGVLALQLDGAARAAGRRRTVGAVFAVAGAVWIAASAVFAHLELYEPHHGPTPWLVIAFVGVLGAALLASRAPTARRILGSPDSAARLTWPHAVRVVGIVFVIVMAQGHLPALFALPAGLGDIAVGLTAPAVALRLRRDDGDEARRAARRFHLMGLLDLGVAITLGLFGGLGNFRPFHITPSTEPLSTLPLALVPTVAVPLAIALHIVTLAKLRGPVAAPTAAARERRAPASVPA